ncbi:AAA family ATPase [Tengunoibacter tsumagoiensis]|uniref:AAA+ ATPase domain-containing protein n=1 Tax=Tengunoibacter tsumagoiensis TaxID=2014871 RepID=A0A402A610_9CHLR|nr:MoxR family ATPase [Tengunoibacter tsumagoiensis]GCE14578.1 hypothetical protein KTT_44370 [Tengunoibacter tsumagoiensis]
MDSRVDLFERYVQSAIKGMYEIYETKNQLTHQDTLNRYYATFKARFGPDVLEQWKSYDDKRLLQTLYHPGRTDSLMSWLQQRETGTEYKSADFDSSVFGSFSLKDEKHLDLFYMDDKRSPNGQKWHTGSVKNPTPIADLEAEKKARKHLLQLLGANQVLSQFSGERDEDYTFLQQRLEQVAPDLVQTAWAHKYFCILYHNYLVDYHFFEQQRFHLIKALIHPPAGEDQLYLANGRFAELTKQLKVPLNTLTRLLSRMNTQVHNYWRVDVRPAREAGKWETMLDGEFCGADFDGIGSMSRLADDEPSRVKLNSHISELHADYTPRQKFYLVEQFIHFCTGITEGDLILASCRDEILAVGHVVGDYSYEQGTDFPHRLPVKWDCKHAWYLPDPESTEGQGTLVYKLRDASILLETERQLLTAFHPERFAATFEDQKLAAIPERALRQRMELLRQSLLLDDEVLSRIYRALLQGHVILHGPPGTGKTQLARLIPEILWQPNLENKTVSAPNTYTSYTTTIATATKEWSSSTLISSIVPESEGGLLKYYTRHGYLTGAILRNWGFSGINISALQADALKKRFYVGGQGSDRPEQLYRGHWLVIDEFNRADMDIALGEALTALSDGLPLQVPIDGKLVSVPLPQDFRIIGTINTSGPHLTRLSEPLMRRFSFVEIKPPTRRWRREEMAIVLYKALERISHLDLQQSIQVESTKASWQNVIAVRLEASGYYRLDETQQWVESALFLHVFEQIWNFFEVLRIFHQFGTAQAIMLLQNALLQVVSLQNRTHEEWFHAFDTAFCDTLFDQLQALGVEDIEILLHYLNGQPDMFEDVYTQFLQGSLPKEGGRRAVSQEALRAHARSLYRAQSEVLSEQDLTHLFARKGLSSQTIAELFHLSTMVPLRLPELKRRLLLAQMEYRYEY